MTTPMKQGAGRPQAGYRLANGERVPSVTTILSRFKDSGGIIHWAWDLGMKGIDYRAARDKAAEAGTIAHAAVEAHLHRRPFRWEDVAQGIKPEAERAFAAFVEWQQQTRLEVTHTEMPLVSEQHHFGGTFDAILVQGKRSIGDWKSSGGIYPEYLVQIAAYGKLWQENFPQEPLEGGYHLLRFDKTHGDFTHRWWGELDSAWEAFLLLRRLYEIDKELKQRAK